MVNQEFSPEVISGDRNGSVYLISSGSGGYKASYEAVKVFQDPDETYTVKFISPASVTTVEEEVPTAEEAIKLARGQAQSINIGMPGTGKITVPDFDMSQIPEE